jgi:hypothetical protein
VLGVVSSPPETLPRRAVVLRTLIRLGCLLALAVAVGAAAGVAWWAVVDLPTYRVHSDGGAATTERGLSEFISADAWFVAIGVVVGLGLGMAGWRWLRRMGWSLVLVVAFAALAAELTCWLVGYRLGPGEFAPRLAAAKPGDLVPIELTLRARASLLTWPFFAVIPILLGSSLGRDDEDPRPIIPRRARR